MRHCVVYVHPQQMAPPASAYSGGEAVTYRGGGALYGSHRLRYSMK